MKQTLANLKIFYEKYFIAKQIEPKIFNGQKNQKVKITLCIFYSRVAFGRNPELFWGGH